MPTPGGAPAPGRKHLDWEAIRGEYRTGAFSVRQIASKFGCSDTLIRRRIKEEGWQKDLADEVRKATDELLVRADVRTANARDDALTVAEAAETRVAAVLGHRRTVARDLARLEALGKKLDALIPGVGDMKGLGGAQDILESMARTRARLIPLERQAFGLAAADAVEDRGGITKVERVVVDPANSNTTGVPAFAEAGKV